MRYLLFFLSPLFYSIDGDPYRAYEVVLVAGVFGALFLRPRMPRIGILEPAVVVSYSLFLVIQQAYIEAGDLAFGIRFMVATIAAFLPFWVLRSSHWYRADMVTPLCRAINALLVISVANIFASFFLGIGERYNGGFLGYRAFGYLGDSFTPVLVFVILFYFFEKRWLFCALALTCLLMTGGKSGVAMTAAAFSLYYIFISKSVAARVFFAAMAGILFLLPIGIDETVQNIRNFQFSLNNRLFSFRIGWEYFIANPVTGIGINQGLHSVNADVAMLARSLGETQFFPVNQIHNAYIRALAETGVIGFSLLVILSLYWLRTGFRAVLCARSLPAGHERSFLAAAGIWVLCFVLGYQTTGWFLHGHPQLAWLLVFTSYAAIIRARVIARRDRGATRPVPGHALSVNASA